MEKSDVVYIVQNTPGGAIQYQRATIEKIGTRYIYSAGRKFDKQTLSVGDEVLMLAKDLAVELTARELRLELQARLNTLSIQKMARCLSKGKWGYELVAKKLRELKQLRKQVSQ